MKNVNHLGEVQHRISAFDPQRVQREALLRIVKPNEHCEYGRKHRFAGIGTVAEFQARVPVCRYEDLRPNIERMVQGEPGVLVSEPVRRFFLTSGSTAAPKYIPITSSFVRDKWRAFQTYWGMVRQDHPSTIGGCWITNFSDGSREQTTPGGGLCSSESSFWNAFGGGDRKADYPLPREVLNILVAEARYYTIARILLETDVSVLMALNPSTIACLFDALDRHGDLLIEDVRNGGLSAAMNVGSRVRQYVAARYPGNAARANELRAILDDRQAGSPATRLWPKLQLAICWRSPMVRPYIDLLERFMGGIPQRDYITMASEGVIAIPFEDGVSGGALAVDIHFYEFIPEQLAEWDDPPTLLAHEIELDGKYVVVLSTSAGLYRYNIGDVVQVRDFIGTTPVVEFLYRAGHTCSMTGEKLTEEQVVSGVSEVATRLGLHMQAFTMCPVAIPFPHYALLAELEMPTDRDLLNRFLSEVDVELGRRNVEYRSKRDSRRLGAPELWLLRSGSYAALRQRRIEAGVSDVQVKVSCLVRDPSWWRQFEIVEQISCESAA
jgi:GH3 auxin-responsive promoter